MNNSEVAGAGAAPVDPVAVTRLEPPFQYSHDEIAARARAIWEQKGEPRGEDEAIWLEAERDLQSGASAETNGGPR